MNWWTIIQDVQTYAPVAVLAYVAGLLSMLAIRG